ncbi:MAG: arginine repressor [Clostridia bacterium]|nr:arginine repressor [Clostridia bacterium]
MKARRHALILAVIKEQAVRTQEELSELLKKWGVEVTQATLSRDIKELGLIKIPTPEGSYRYALPGEKLLPEVIKRAERMFSDTVVAIDFTENLIVIKTTSGNAQGVAAIIDELDWKEIVGTIAGDDSILVIVRNKEQVEGVLNRLHKLRR